MSKATDGIPVRIERKEIRFDYDRERRLACLKLLDGSLYHMVQTSGYLWVPEPYGSKLELALEAMIGLICLFKTGKR